MREQHFPGPVGLIGSPRTNTGDGHRMAADAGAALARMDQANMFPATVARYEGQPPRLPAQRAVSTALHPGRSSRPALRQRERAQSRDGARRARCGRASGPSPGLAHLRRAIRRAQSAGDVARTATARLVPAGADDPALAQAVGLDPDALASNRRALQSPRRQRQGRGFRARRDGLGRADGAAGTGAQSVSRHDRAAALLRRALPSRHSRHQGRAAHQCARTSVARRRQRHRRALLRGSRGRQSDRHQGGRRRHDPRSVPHLRLHLRPRSRRAPGPANVDACWGLRHSDRCHLGNPDWSQPW